MRPKGSDYEANTLSEKTDLAMTRSGGKPFWAEGRVSAKALW